VATPSWACIGLAVVASLTVARADAGRGKKKIPDCLSSKNDAPGTYEVTLEISSLTAKDVFRFLSALTQDPIWPEGITTNENFVNRKQDLITAVVKPNLNRFDKGTTLEQTRSKVEAAIARLLAMKGVSVICPQAGE
jgi:hypothetical protein